MPTSLHHFPHKSYIGGLIVFTLRAGFSRRAHLFNYNPINRATFDGNWRSRVCTTRKTLHNCTTHTHIHSPPIQEAETKQPKLQVRHELRQVILQTHSYSAPHRLVNRIMVEQHSGSVAADLFETNICCICMRARVHSPRFILWRLGMAI